MASELVTIKTFRFTHEAEFARLVLQEEGIQVFLADLETVSMYQLLGNVIGGIKLQVSSERAEEALAILGSLGNYKKPLDSGHDDGETIRCLDCGKVIPSHLSDCPECGWSYGEEDYEEEENEGSSEA